MQYLARWPEYFQVAEAPNGEIMGYSKSLHYGYSSFFFPLHVIQNFLQLWEKPKDMEPTGMVT